MASGTINVRIFPIPEAVGLAPIAPAPVEAAGTITVAIGAAVFPSAVDLDPAAHAPVEAGGTLAARIHPVPVGLQLDPAAHAQTPVAGTISTRIHPLPAGLHLTPLVQALEARASLPARILARPYAPRMIVFPQHRLQASGLIRVEVYPFVRLSYVAKLRQDTAQRLARLSQFRRVFDSRQAQISRAMLPAIRLYTSQSSESRSISIPDFLTTTLLTVQIIAEDITDVASAERIDELVDDVKDWLMGDPEWLTSFERIANVGTEIDRNIEGESRTTIATISFALTISEWYEPRIPDRLDTVNMKVDVIRPAADPNTGPPGVPPNVPGGYPGGYPGPDGRIEAEFQINIPPPPLPTKQEPA